MSGDVMESRAGMAGAAADSAGPKLERAADRDDINSYGPDYARFCGSIKELTSIDLSHYKGQQMHRRLESYRSRHGLPTFKALGESVRDDPDSLRALLDYLTINVSEFFRNPEQWVTLREKVLPAIKAGAWGRAETVGGLGSSANSGASSAARFVRNVDPVAAGSAMGVRPPMRAWSAGSSGGQEAYTLAMVLCEEGMPDAAIVGTDIDEPSLRKAADGLYRREEVTNIPQAFLDKYFKEENGGYRTGARLRRMVRFERGNLLADQYPQGLDLILCRNVLIYFTEKVKEQVISKFARSLRQGGVLFTGSTEAIFTPELYGLTQIQPFFYRRTAL